MPAASFRFRVAREIEDEVVKALLAQRDVARGYCGCTGCHVERDVWQRGGVRFHSSWDSEVHLREFLASRAQTRILQLLELSVEEPEFLICTGTSRSALETLQEIRGACRPRPEPPRSHESSCTRDLQRIDVASDDPTRGEFGKR
jgi:hypothetical protein